MKPRIRVLTLGVDDLDRALAFYRDGLGLPTEGIVGTEFKDGAVVFFELTNDLVLALYPRSSLAKDANSALDSPSPSDFSVGHNVSSKDEVDAVIDQARAAGGQVTDPPRDRFWGGYSGYFQDPDGHLWEIAWNPGWQSRPSLLATLAAHNAWANQRLIHACSQVDPARLAEATDDYDSVIGILEHLVQVEHSFFELAHGRTPRRIDSEDLDELRTQCALIDDSYVEYTRSLDLADAESRRFLVPWFGFEITLAEGVLQPMTHSHKHRADISMLLPRIGGNGVEMDLIQWLAEQRDSGSWTA